MLFTTLDYLLFLPAVAVLYWIAPNRLRVPLLIAASYGFYMSWNVPLIFLLAGLTIVNFLIGFRINANETSRKAWLSLGVTINLASLCFFKYAGFLTDSMRQSVSLLSHRDPGWHVEILLPLAISFFTFEFIHYLVDIYRGREPIRSFPHFVLFACYFPSLIAGPIKRYEDFNAQVCEPKKFRLAYLDEGVPLLIMGFAKKLLVADTLAVFTGMGFAMPEAYGALEWWLFAYAFALQIYFDFSGYTDIARGSSMLLGIRLPINFNLPYIASNMSEFWHRWHISLSTWLRDYLFIPLGGSRVGRWEVNRNLFIVMALGGLWHGAGWNFLLWGIGHGLALIVHREFKSFRKSVAWLSTFVESSAGRIASTILVFHVWASLFILFGIHDLGKATGVLWKLYSFRPFLSPVDGGSLVILRPDLPVVVLISLVLTLVLLVATLPIGTAVEKGILEKAPIPLKGLYACILLVVLVVLLPDTRQTFYYFQF